MLPRLNAQRPPENGAGEFAAALAAAARATYFETTVVRFFADSLAFCRWHVLVIQFMYQRGLFMRASRVRYREHDSRAPIIFRNQKRDLPPWSIPSEPVAGLVASLFYTSLQDPLSNCCFYR